MHRRPLMIQHRLERKRRRRAATAKLLKAVDFFCGAGGMSYGLSKARIKVLAGIDCDGSCRETYERNNKPARFIEKNIAKLSPRWLGKKLRISRHDDSLIFVACSPCQFWTKINTDKKKNRQSAFLLAEFERFVDWFNPGFVIIENVPGLSKKRASLLPQFRQFLRDRKYAFKQGVVNSNRQGVPQNRKRYLLIATRLAKKVDFPRELKTRPVVRDFIGKHNGFAPIKAGHRDSTQFLHTAAALSVKNLQRIKKTPIDGGTRKSWKSNSKLQIPAYEGKDGIFRDVYGRMRWHHPAPTVTTRFNSFSNGRFGHPQENRAISLREGATLQTFPKRYVFKATNQATIARQIGNAVPPALAKRIGRHVVRINCYL
jgi:DNA (cytosine-5)-methyltransferase 1